MTTDISVQQRSLFSLSRKSAWLALFGLAWSLFGIVQFAAISFKSVEQLTAAGMTAAQATLYAGLPAWMTLSFAIGVFGGTAGSALLIAARRAAVPVLTASLAGYLVLFAGDALLGVFAAFGIGQVLVLGFVVAVAVLLLLTARRLASAGRLN
jgi:hypothetical protein